MPWSTHITTGMMPTGIKRSFRLGSRPEIFFEGFAALRRNSTVGLKNIEHKSMKSLKHSFATLLTTALLAVPIVALADDAKKADKPKPYPLKTCITDGEKLGSMGAPYVFTHEGREIKLCCKGCLDDFKKDSAKYMKQLDEADKKQKK